MHLTAGCGKLNLLPASVLSKALLTHKDYEGKTALHYGIHLQKFEPSMLDLDMIWNQDMNQKTPAHIAAVNQHLEYIPGNLLPFERMNSKNNKGHSVLGSVNFYGLHHQFLDSMVIMTMTQDERNLWLEDMSEVAKKRSPQVVAMLAQTYELQTWQQL